MNIELLNSLLGGPELLDWFDGYAPRFHDAEVLSIAFDREGPTCTLRVHAFETTSAVNANGFNVHKRHVVVTFRIDEITEMRLEDFNHQNALMGLRIVRSSDEGLRVDLDPAYGLSGSFDGRSISITLEPGAPTGSQYETRTEGG